MEEGTTSYAASRGGIMEPRCKDMGCMALSGIIRWHELR